MNFYSLASCAYKNSLLRTRIEGNFRINNTWTGFHQDISKNEYPRKLINNYIHKYLDNKDNDSKKEDTTGKNIRYFELSYIGMMSTYTQ